VARDQDTEARDWESGDWRNESELLGYLLFFILGLWDWENGSLKCHNQKIIRLSE